MAKGVKTGGRKKGTPNIATRIRDAVFDALHEAKKDENGKALGAKAYLVWLANEHPKAFSPLVGKILPQAVEVTGEDGGPLTFAVIAPTKDAA